MNRQKVKAVAVAEALGLLDPLISVQRYWVHLLNLNREHLVQFKIFFRKHQTIS